MWNSRLASGVLSALILGGCTADPTNDPRSGGFFGGVHGLAAGDYEMRQQALQGQRDDSLNQLRALREEADPRTGLEVLEARLDHRRYVRLRLEALRRAQRPQG